jgi:predicted nucleic acid-binding protein
VGDPKVYLDNTVLSNLASVGRTDLVQRLWADRTATTPQALAEYEAGAGQGNRPHGAWSWISIAEWTQEDEALVNTLPNSLGPGERSCLAAAKRNQGVLATDDGDARRVSQRKQVTVTGTVGILRLAVERGLLAEAEANGLLTAMVRNGYFSPVASVLDRPVPDTQP